MRGLELIQEEHMARLQPAIRRFKISEGRNDFKQERRRSDPYILKGKEYDDLFLSISQLEDGSLRQRLWDFFWKLCAADGILTITRKKSLSPEEMNKLLEKGGLASAILNAKLPEDSIRREEIPDQEFESWASGEPRRQYELIIESSYVFVTSWL